MDLFEYAYKKSKEKEKPLSLRLRPNSLEEIIGQEHIIGKDKLLYRAIKADKLKSIIFYGPPGTGKTTIANVIANTTKCEFIMLNATMSGKKEMAEGIEKAKNIRISSGKRTIFFIDEIHRFNKSQQDYLLPFVEEGLIILIGATTENPYFEVNKALISRSIIFKLEPLSDDNINKIIKIAVYDKIRGMGEFNAEITEEAVNDLVRISSGDARKAINAIELAILTTNKNDEGKIILDREVISDCIQNRVVFYDKDGDNHYDVISAFIKSMRGSDPDASVFYLSRMLLAGEDIKFIARRMMICASEDVGNANPNALVVATNAALAVERVGMPEAQLILAQAAIYIANSPKSNSVTKAIFAANDINRNVKTTVPIYLRDAHYSGHEKFGHGVGYKYPHDYEGNYVKQQYLPDEIKNMKFYHPSKNGEEKNLFT